AELLLAASADEHGRVRMEAIQAASWLATDKMPPVWDEAIKHPIDSWMADAYQTAADRLKGATTANEPETAVTAATGLEGAELARFKQGRLLCQREGFCITCRQADGKGLPS